MAGNVKACITRLLSLEFPHRIECLRVTKVSEDIDNSLVRGCPPAYMRDVDGLPYARVRSAGHHALLQFAHVWKLHEYPDVQHSESYQAKHGGGGRDQLLRGSQISPEVREQFRAATEGKRLLCVPVE